MERLSPWYNLITTEARVEALRRLRVDDLRNNKTPPGPIMDTINQLVKDDAISESVGRASKAHVKVLFSLAKSVDKGKVRPTSKRVEHYDSFLSSILPPLESDNIPGG